MKSAKLGGWNKIHMAGVAKVAEVLPFLPKLPQQKKETYGKI